MKNILDILSSLPKNILISCLENMISIKNNIKNGVFVIPILSEDELKYYNHKVKNMKFPEFKDEYKGPYSMGGFGALGVASSFHHKDIREIRKIVKERFKKYLQIIFTKKYIEGFFDRLCIRNKKFGTIQAESWHQDILDPNSFKNAKFSEEDIMYGGWLNLNILSNQQFICAPNTQLDRAGECIGFAPIKDENDIKYYSDLEKIIDIPPGHAIFIQQGLVHRVNPKLPNENSYRLFHGFRITNSDKALLDLNHIFDNLSVPLLPSGQSVPLYAKLHWVNSRKKLTEFANNMNEDFTYYRIVKSGKDKNVEYKVPGDKEFESIHSMKGLREHDIWTSNYYDYTLDDKEYFKPELI